MQLPERPNLWAATIFKFNVEFNPKYFTTYILTPRHVCMIHQMSTQASLLTISTESDWFRFAKKLDLSALSASQGKVESWSEFLDS